MSVSSRLNFLILLLFWGCQMEEPAQPVAKFTILNDNCIGPCTVSFTDASENTSVYTWTYAWDFGDGSTSLEKNPVHNYKGAGNFLVKFTLNGKYGSAAYSDTVVIKGVPAPMPVASFTFTAGNLEIDKEVSFTNTSKNAVSYLWNFGDKSADSTSAMLNPKHTFKKEGKYAVKLTATGPGGKVSHTDSIVIKKLAIVAEFKKEVSVITSDSTKITFKNNSLNAAKYEWDFGDKNKSTETNPVHWYIRGVSDTTYTIKLTAADIANTKVVKTDTLLVKMK